MTSRTLSISGFLFAVLLTFSFLLSCTVQGSPDQTSGLDGLDAKDSHGRTLLTRAQDKLTHARAVRVRRRKPTPKHKRQAKTNVLTEDRGKDGTLNSWTRTHSVSSLDPRRERAWLLSKRKQQVSRAKRLQRQRRNKRPAPKLVRPRKTVHTDKAQPAAARQTHKKSRIGAPERRIQPLMRRKNGSAAKMAPKNGNVSRRSRISAPKRRVANRGNQQKNTQKSGVASGRHQATSGLHWQGKGRHGFKWNNQRKRPHRIPWKGKVVYDEGDVICVAQSEKTMKATESQSAQIHASAVASAFEYLCDPGPDLDLVVLEEWFEEAEAHALAEAAVRAQLTCKSKNRKTPNTCVSYSASATAIAEATMEAHAEAVTVAMKACPCMNSDSISAFASADMFVELVADAAVTAEATVCVEGKEIETQVVWEKCTSSLYAKLFARAAAEAATHGTCLDAEAKGAVHAYVGADITIHNTPQCDARPQLSINGETQHKATAV
eukprot:jgi/Ulvmu1/8340/UM042_0046.1